MSVKEVFQQDNPLNAVMTKIFDLIVLNILWLVCCVPIITIGASSTALYYMTLKMVRNQESGIVKGFFKSFRKNFRQSVPVTLLLLLFVGILVTDFHILGNSGQKGNSVMYGVCITILIMGSAVFSYTFPLLAKFENTVRNTILNAAKIAVTHMKQTAVILVINFIPLLWLLISPETFSMVFWVWIFAGTGVSALLNSMLLVRIFDEFIPKDNKEDNLENIE